MNHAMTTVHAAAAVLPDGSVLSPARVAVQDGLIRDVSRGTFSTPHENGGIDLGETILFPGFTNAHCHLELTALGPLPRSDFIPWVRELMRRKSALTDDEIAAGIRDGAKRLLSSGVTTVLDHVSPETPLSCFRGLPIRAIAFGEILGVSEPRARASWQTWDQARKHSPVPVHPTPHSAYSLNVRVWNEFREQESGPVSVHVLESEEERLWFDAGLGAMADFLRGFDATLTQPGASALETLFGKAAPHDALLVHGNEFRERDFDALTRAKNVCVVHCPGSFAFFGHARFPFEELRRRGVPVALGTDSLSSNSALDFLHELRLFLAAHPGLPFEDLLPMITTNALTAIGVKNGGRIAAGHRADLIGFSRSGDETPLEVLKNARQTDFTMIGGEILGR